MSMLHLLFPSSTSIKRRQRWACRLGVHRLFGSGDGMGFVLKPSAGPSVIQVR